MKNKGVTFYIFVVLILAFAMILAAQPQGVSQAQDGEYVSDWVYIPAGSSYAFSHGLSSRPLHVSVWVALPVTKIGSENTPSDYSEVVPISERPGLHVRVVGPQAIVIQNSSVSGYSVQVCAK